jgi:hypothetical protein
MSCNHIDFKHIPRPDYDKHPAYGGFFETPSLLDRVRAVKFLFPHLVKVNQDRLQWRRIFTKHKRSQKECQHGQWGADHEATLSKLGRDGAVAFRLPESEVSGLCVLLQPYISELQQQRASIKKRSHADNHLQIKDAQVIQRIQEDFACHGFLNVASAYVRMPLKIRRVTLIINDESDTSYWKGEFSPLGLGYPETTYMHIDSTYGPGKFLVYLSEVAEKTGPFCYVLGSHRFHRSAGELLIRKAMDKSGLDSRGVERRQIFWALPRFLQKKAAFGYDLDMSDPATKALLEAEHKFLSKDGNVIYFDFNGVHRGGMIQTGVRSVLQVFPTPA